MYFFVFFQYKMKNGTTRILGIGKVDDQWLILNLGFNKAPKNNNQKIKTIISWNMGTVLTPEEIHIESQLGSRPLY